MIVLHISNRMERLTEQLFAEIRENPPPPWSSVTILPQNPTIGRWLSFRLADEQGVAMNIDTPLPGAWVRSFLDSGSSGLEQAVHFERNALFVRILRQIPTLCDTPSFSEIRRYLEGGDTSRRLVSLADELSELFDRGVRETIVTRRSEGSGTRSTIPSRSRASTWAVMLVAVTPRRSFRALIIIGPYS